MSNRTFRFMGLAYSNSGQAALTVSFNNSVVFDGLVNAHNESEIADRKGRDAIPENLFQFETDRSLSGNIPLSITVNAGYLDFCLLEANYMASGTVLSKTRTDPSVPINSDDPTTYTISWGDTEAVQRADVNIPVDLSNPATYTLKPVVMPADAWGDPNLNSSSASPYADGKSNVFVNGVEMIPNVMDPIEVGEWQYFLSYGDTLTCDYYVDPTLVLDLDPPIGV